MSADKEKLRKLAAIADMLRDRDLADLAAKQREKDRRSEIRNAFAQEAQTENQAMVADPAYRRHHEEQRRLWRTRQHYAMSHYEARAAALVESQKRIAARSFGRALALARLASSTKDR